MPPRATLLVSDAHLGHAPDTVETAFHRFLERVPEHADHLIINGDLFEFWFEYRTVVPRSAFATLAALRSVRDAGVRLTVTGGNHDRFGGAFWEEEMGAEFHRNTADLTIDGLRTVVTHGDGIADPVRGSRLLQWIVHHRFTATLFRWIHPDLGLRLVERWSGTLPSKRFTDERIERSAQAQAEYARRYLRERREVDLLVLGHTHRAVLEQVDAGRWYLNPGAWLDGLRYARITDARPRLEVFDGE